MRKTLVSISFLLLAGYAQAQSVPSWDYTLHHLDAGLSVGTSGIGLDLTAPVNDLLDVRMGLNVMPQFHKEAHFDVQIGETPESKYDEQGNRVETKFDRMSTLLSSFTGYKVQESIGMDCQPTYHNFKLILDVKPFTDRRWHLSLGFYYGNRTVARSVNNSEAMTSLLAVGMYNRIYDAALNEDPVINYNGLTLEFPPDINQKILGSGRMAVPVGEWKHNVYYEEDVYTSDGKDLLHSAGELKHAAGSPYMMEPGADGMVRVKMTARRFKPYLGGGYRDQLDREGHWHWSADAGLLFWGGVPCMHTHEGVCLTHDVVNIGGKPGRYVDMARALPVFPVLELRLMYRFF